MALAVVTDGRKYKRNLKLASSSTTLRVKICTTVTTLDDHR